MSIHADMSWQAVDPKLWMITMQPLHNSNEPCFAFNQKDYCEDHVNLYISA
jgi:hypothetical protein